MINGQLKGANELKEKKEYLKNLIQSLRMYREGRSTSEQQRIDKVIHVYEGWLQLILNEFNENREDRE